MSRANILATDLDGTLIPLSGNTQNQSDLNLLLAAVQQKKISIVFVTGRHLESVEKAIQEFELPVPDWIICDVGASVCSITDGQWNLLPEYAAEMRSRLKSDSLLNFHSRFGDSKLIRLQEPAKQSDFKMSFYADAGQLKQAEDELLAEIKRLGINGRIISSVDPFNGDGLLDVLPHDVSKAFALDWCCKNQEWSKGDVVFAGDSGNDFAALTAGYRSIVVGNASSELVDSVLREHRTRQWNGRLHIAAEVATSAVVEGCRQFGLI